MSHSTCRRLRLRNSSASFCFQANHTFLKQEVPGRARHARRHIYFCARGGGGVCSHGGCITPNTPPTSGLACALQPFQSSSVTLCCRGNQTRPWTHEHVRAKMSRRRCLGSRKRQTDTIVTVKWEICYFSMRGKNTLDMLISKLAPLSANIDAASDLKNLKLSRRRWKGAARRDVFACTRFTPTPTGSHGKLDAATKEMKTTEIPK